MSDIEQQTSSKQRYNYAEIARRKLSPYNSSNANSVTKQTIEVEPIHQQTQYTQSMPLRSPIVAQKTQTFTLGQSSDIHNSQPNFPQNQEMLYQDTSSPRRPEKPSTVRVEQVRQ